MYDVDAVPLPTPCGNTDPEGTEKIPGMFICPVFGSKDLYDFSFSNSGNRGQVLTVVLLAIRTTLCFL